MGIAERTVTIGDRQGIHGRTARTIVIVKRLGVRCTLSQKAGTGAQSPNGL